MRLVTKPSSFLPAAVVALAACCCDANDGAEWRYVADEEFGQVPWQSIRLSDQRLDDMRIDVEFRGSRTAIRSASIWIAEFDAGDCGRRSGCGGATSIFMLIAIEIVRSRRKTSFRGTGGRGCACCRSQMTHLIEVSYEPRSVRFRLGITGRTLSYSTIGFVAGRTTLGDRSLRVRRVDGDGNGFFADARDRLWIDLDGNDEWDPFTEQFPFLPIMKIRQQRLAVRGDAIGKQLELKAITDVGQVQLRFETLVPGAEIAQLDVMLTGEDGSAFTIRSRERIDHGSRRTIRCRRRSPSR